MFNFADYGGSQAHLGFRKYFQENKPVHVVIGDSRGLDIIPNHDIFIVVGESCVAPSGYKVCDLYLNCGSFDTCLYEERSITVIYKEHLKFNITKPVLRDKYLLPSDVLKEQSVGGNAVTSVGVDTRRRYLNILPNGYSVEQLINWYPATKIEGTTKFDEEMYRPYLNWPCAISRYGYIVHPEKPRFLTQTEMSAICGVEIPNDTWPGDCLPVKMSEWLALQCYYCLRGDWGEKDWQATYSKGKWENPPIEGDRKVFDLFLYTPSVEAGSSKGKYLPPKEGKNPNYNTKLLRNLDFRPEVFGV